MAEKYQMPEDYTLEQAYADIMFIANRVALLDFNYQLFVAGVKNILDNQDLDELLTNTVSRLRAQLPSEQANTERYNEYY